MHGGLSGGRGAGENGVKVQGIRNINGRYKIDTEVKNSIGNGQAKELICTTHGHELRGGDAGEKGTEGQRGIRGEKNGTTVITYSIKCF